MRLFLIIQILIFALAALLHFDVLFGGYADQSAGIAESVIAGVLLVGLAITWIRPDWARTSGIAVQSFALLGTFVGLTLLLTVGPTTGLDLGIHVVMVVILIAGLIVTARRPAGV